MFLVGKERRLSSKRIIKVDGKTVDAAANIKAYPLHEVNACIKTTLSKKNVEFPGLGAGKTALKQEIEAIREKAYQEGYKTGKRLGFDEGVSQGRAKIAELEGSLVSILSELTCVGETVVRNLEKELLILSLRIAARIVKKEIQQDEKVILEVVRSAIKHTFDKDGLKVKMNPLDVELMKRFEGDLLSEIRGLKGLIMLEDESISRGGCFIETAYGDIDARIESQVEIVLDELRNWVTDKK